MGAADTDEGEGEETSEDDHPAYRPSRLTITGRSDLEMHTFGWLMFLIMIVVMIPLLPIILLLAAIGHLLGFGQPRATAWESPHP